MLDTLIEILQRRQPLAPEQVQAAVAALAGESGTPELKAAFLTALAEKGETPEEIAAFARELSARAVQPALDPGTRAGVVIDVCGTGGDRLNTFNISTTVALVVSAAGVTTAKHGNRAITSKSGSADVLEALGVRIELSAPETARWLREYQFAFFFAPLFHPAFKHIVPARKLCAQRGQRTIFNFLGPLLNPARPSAQLIGVPHPSLCEPLGRVLQSLGVRQGMVVCGQVPGPAFLDELSTLGPTTIAEFYHDRGFIVSELSATAFSFQAASLEDLTGGDRETNAGIVRGVLGGTDRGPRRDAVLLNAGAALFVAGRARSISDGIELAGKIVDSGEATKKLNQLVEASSKTA